MSTEIVGVASLGIFLGVVVVVFTLIAIIYYCLRSKRVYDTSYFRRV